MASPLQPNITTNGFNPKSARGPDGTEVTSHSLPDQIAADRYLATQAAKTRKYRGIKVTKIISPSPSGVNINPGGGCP
jgi:hypothetical protein